MNGSWKQRERRNNRRACAYFLNRHIRATDSKAGRIGGNGVIEV